MVLCFLNKPAAEEIITVLPSYKSLPFRFIFLTPHDDNCVVPLSPCWPGEPGLPGKPFLPAPPGSPRGPCLPGGPGGPGGPGLLLRYMPLGIWFSNVLTRVICAATAEEEKNSKWQSYCIMKDKSGC